MANRNRQPPPQPAPEAEDRTLSASDEVKTLAGSIMQNGQKVYEHLLFLIDEVSNQEDPEYSKPEGLTAAQERMLLAVRRHGRVALTRLAEDLKVTAPSASTMVDRLVEKGLLERTHSRDDRRKVVITASEEALTLVDRVEERINAFFEDLVRRVGLETARQWSQVLERVREVLE